MRIQNIPRCRNFARNIVNTKAKLMIFGSEMLKSQNFNEMHNFMELSLFREILTFCKEKLNFSIKVVLSENYLKKTN